MKYFGTDGIRGVVGKDLSSTLIKKVAKAIVLYYNKHKIKRVILVGNDSRQSSDYILAILETNLLKHGIRVENLGLCSSPCLAYLTKKYNYPIGLMLSASHNPSEYNGLKFFNCFGEKVDDSFEKEFEGLMDKKTKLKTYYYEKEKCVEILKQDYIHYLKKLKKFNFPVIIDASNGGTSEIVKSVFSKQEKIHSKPNGLNINKNCGCTNIEVLKSLCVKKQKIGFALDGDGDRIHIVDKNVDVLTGDKIIHVLSKIFQKQGDICVGTVYSNTGLEIGLKERNIALKRSEVGDKKVYDLMKKNNSILGGEDSGHIILRHYMNTGDGIMNAIIFANILQLSKLSIKELLANYSEYTQLRKNLPLTDCLSLESQIIETIKNKYKDARIIIRPSGTEPILRVFVEHKEKYMAEKILNEIMTVFTS